MITLHVFGPHFGQIDASPFCAKAIVLLKMSGLPFQTAKADLRKAPKGKAPYMYDDEELVSDSTFIRFHLENQHGIDFDPGLTDAQKGIAWAFEKMCEDQLYWATVQQRWMIDANFDRGPRNFFKPIPALLRPIVISKIRKDVKQALHGQGFGRHSPSEITTLIMRALTAISAQLGDKKFLMGDNPCGADASVFPAVAGLLCDVFDNPYHEKAKKLPNLHAYCERGRARWQAE